MIENLDSLHLRESDNIDKEELKEVLREAYSVSEELYRKLQKVKVHIISGENPEIIKAISTIFGDRYILENGNSTITYEMYCYVIDLIREIGKRKAQEML